MMESCLGVFCAGRVFRIRFLLRSPFAGSAFNVVNRVTARLGVSGMQASLRPLPDTGRLQDQTLGETHVFDA